MVSAIYNEFSAYFNGSYKAGSGSYDNNPACGDYIDSIWEEIQVMQKNGPSDGNVSALMQSVNDFLAYIKTNGLPDPSKDPITSWIYDQITTTGLAPGMNSLSSYCSADNRYAIENSFTSMGGSYWKSLANSLGVWSGGYTHQNPSNLAQDLQRLLNDLSGTIDPAHLAGVAQDLQAVMNDLSNLPGGVKDGYLRDLEAFFDNTTNNSKTSLASLVAAYEKNPSDPTAQKNLLDALTQLDGPSPSSQTAQQALASLITFMQQEGW